MMTLNAMPFPAAVTALLACCGSTRWARQMVGRRPFVTAGAMAGAADEIWRSLGADDWREAFAAHPRIGDSGPRPPVPGAREQGARAEEQSVGRAPDASKEWSAAEQSGMAAASADVRDRLARANRDYEARFGYIFIVCATGKSAREMLGMLESRLQNPPDEELLIAAEEQRRIMQLRLAKLVG